MWSSSFRQRCLRVVKRASRDSSPPLTWLFALGLGRGEKPDSHTRRVDFYLERGDRDYTLANPQNLLPIFTQEQLATSPRATQLRDVATDAVALVDCSVPTLDISAGLSVDSLAVVNSTSLSREVSPRAFPCLSSVTADGPPCILPRVSTRARKHL